MSITHKEVRPEQPHEPGSRPQVTTRRYALMVVEGPTDQAVVKRALKVLGFKEFGGDVEKLDPFWEDAKVVPTYPPKKGNLYERLSMPSILSSDTWSVAVYTGGGSKLVKQVTALLENRDLHEQLHAFAVVADADHRAPVDIARKYSDDFNPLFPALPGSPGEVAMGPPALGIFVFPDNKQSGVVEHLILECGQSVYPGLLTAAEQFVQSFDAASRRDAKWAPFDELKAQVACVASVLKPGKTNTASIADNLWISEQTKTLPMLNELVTFLLSLLGRAATEGPMLQRSAP